MASVKICWRKIEFLSFLLSSIWILWILRIHFWSLELIILATITAHEAHEASESHQNGAVSIDFLPGIFTLTMVFAKKQPTLLEIHSKQAPVILGDIPKLRLWCFLFKRSHTEIHAILLRTEILLPDNLQKHTKTTLFKTNGELNAPSSTCFIQKAGDFFPWNPWKTSIIHLGWRLFTHSFTSRTPKLFFAYFVVFPTKPHPPPPKKKKNIYTYITRVLLWK